MWLAAQGISSAFYVVGVVLAFVGIRHATQRVIKTLDRLQVSARQLALAVAWTTSVRGWDRATLDAGGAGVKRARAAGG